MAAEQCSVCGAGTGPDGTPLCDCAPRTAEEAVAAAFDAFRPTRVRPYLAGAADGPETPPTPRAQHPTPPPRRDDVLHSATTDATLAGGTSVGRHAHTGGPKAEDVELFANEPEPDGDRTRPVPAVAPADPAPGPATPRASRRDARRSSSRRRRGAAVVAVAAALSIGVIAFTTSSGDGDKSEETAALPGPSGRAPVTTEEQPTVSEAPSTDRSTSPSAKPSASPSTSSSPSASRRASPSTEPTRVDGGITVRPGPSTPPPSAPDTETPSPPTNPGPPVLREGSSGPEVVELQQRLKQVPWVYVLGSEDGVYDGEVTRAVRDYQEKRNISGDAEGVYGPNTRRALESETSV